ncbi:tail fiber domain-containing protein [Blastomonas sp.]|uniref:tail fiber domain-containing protein n=1 Tax=Blastomonas sp. TaxID=1909299 RepID=UPI0035934435
MPELFFADLVRETSTTSGPGPFALGGAAPGHRSFAGIVPPGGRFHYAIAGVTHEGEWEVGVGEIGSDGLLQRSPLSVSSGTGPFDFSAGLKTVTLTVAAEWFAARDDRSDHDHMIADISGLAAALDGKQPAGSYAAAAHTHDYLPRDGNGNWIAQEGKFGVGVAVPFARMEMRGGDFACYDQNPITTELSPAGAQMFLGDLNYTHPLFWNSAPGIGAVADTTGIAGALGLFSYGGLAGERTLIAVASHHGYPSRAFSPGSDDLIGLGRASHRWALVHAASGTINTSDEREKHWRGSMREAEYRAGLDIAAALGFFQWTSAVAAKGVDAARLHFGPKAQQAFAIMESHGLDWRRYGWCCHDVWEDAEGTHDRYGIRPDQLALFLIAVLARQMAAMTPVESGAPDAAG